MNKHNMALLALIEAGSSPEVAQDTLSRFPEMVESLAARKHGDLVAEAEAEREARHDASPEGRREAARAAVAAQDSRRREVSEAKVLLLSERRVNAEEAAGLDDAQALHLAGFEFNPNIASQREKDHKAEELARGEWQEMPDQARVQWARALNIQHVSSMDSLAAYGPVRPTFAAKTGDPIPGDGAADGGGAEAGE